jgi:molybdopterin converting factor small subunit
MPVRITIKRAGQEPPWAVSELQVEHQLGDIMQSILERAGLGGDEFEVYVVNGRVQGRGAHIQDGDHIRLYPVMAGG